MVQTEQPLRIKLFMHWADLPGATVIANEQITRLRKSRLLESAEVVFVCVNGNIVNFIDSIQLLQDCANVRFVTVSDTVNHCEYPTLTFLQEQVIKDPECAVFYFHLKGVSRNTGPSKDWRLFLEYWNIDNWRANVEMLEQGYETSGVNYTVSPEGNHWPHYSGNFWWARGDYIKRLRQLPDPKLPFPGPVSEFTGYTYDSTQFKFDHEAWIGSGQPNYYEISNSPGKQYTGFHYHYPYPESVYKL